MSFKVIKELLELRLNTVSGVFPTGFENHPFVPVQGVAHQIATILPGQTENPTMGDGFRREVGVLHVMLHFPKQTGAQPALDRAEVLRNGFVRGLSLSSGSVTVKIVRSPYLGSGRSGDSWYSLPVMIPFQADVF